MGPKRSRQKKIKPEAHVSMEYKTFLLVYMSPWIWPEARYGKKQQPLEE